MIPIAEFTLRVQWHMKTFWLGYITSACSLKKRPYLRYLLSD